MQLKKSAALCALALATLAGQAHAAALSQTQKDVIDEANTNNRILFISGASAVQKGFTSIISTLIPGTKTYFTDKNGYVDPNATPLVANTHSYEAVAGQLPNDASYGPWANKNVIIIYRVAGGSVWGVNPVARNEAIESLNVTSSTCSDGGFSAANGSAANQLAFKCSKNTRKPDAGVSDVSPSLFKEPFNTEGEDGNVKAQLSSAELAEFSNSAYNKPIYALAFGVPVTNNVSTALNKSVISAIMTGNVATWNQVDATLPADDIVICRRVPGSGTQAVENMYFGNFPCGESNTPASRNDGGAFDPSATWTWTDSSGTVHSGTGKYTIDPTAQTGGLMVIENSSSGNVDECLKAAVNGGTYVTKDRDGGSAEHLVEFVSGGSKAIGVLSMDSLSKAKSSGAWQFRSLDGNGTYTWDNTANAPVATGTGKHPTLANLIDGTWDMQGWISFNTPNRTVSDANKAPVVAKFLEKAQDPAVLSAVSDLKNVAAAIPGGSYSGAQVLRAAYSNSNQCAPLNRNY